jgi:hypothetical protein
MTSINFEEAIASYGPAFTCFYVQSLVTGMQF